MQYFLANNYFWCVLRFFWNVLTGHFVGLVIKCIEMLVIELRLNLLSAWPDLVAIAMNRVAENAYKYTSSSVSKPRLFCSTLYFSVLIHVCILGEVGYDLK